MGTQTVILVRHAEALEESLGGDPYRELSEAGKTQASQLGQKLLENLSGPLSVFVSPTYRAIQTWMAMAEGAGLEDEDAQDVEQRQEIYWGDSYEGLSIIRFGSQRDATTVIVGHEPTISGLARILAADDVSVPAGMPTGSAVVLSSPKQWEDWGQGQATAAQFVN